MFDTSASDAIDGVRSGLKGASQDLASLTQLSAQFSKSIGDAFTGGIARGRGFDEVLKGVGQRLQQLALSAAIKPLEGLLSKGLESAVSGLANALSSAAGQSLPGFNPGAGGGLDPGSAKPFATGGVFTDGGVVATPTYFPLRGGLGVAGEAGPEAILPLARGADGRLGVRNAGEGRAPSVTVTITTPDADSFRRSQAQVSATIARAVARGQRAM